MIQGIFISQLLKSLCNSDRHKFPLEAYTLFSIRKILKHSVGLRLSTRNCSR
jgi:hypothetical protein